MAAFGQGQGHLLQGGRLLGTCSAVPCGLEPSYCGDASSTVAAHRTGLALWELRVRRRVRGSLFLSSAYAEVSDPDGKDRGLQGSLSKYWQSAQEIADGATHHAQEGPSCTATRAASCTAPYAARLAASCGTSSHGIVRTRS